MQTKSYLTVEEDGLYRVSETKAPLKINEQQIIDNLAKMVTRRCERVVDIGGESGGPYGMSGVSFRQGMEMWSVHINTLMIEAPFYLDQGVHTPAFDDPTQPIMKMEWKPPMNLVLAIALTKDGDRRLAGDHYLIAFDAKGSMWRLPLSNLYEDGKLCHGQGTNWHRSSLAAVTDSCKRFLSSRWNADLYTDGKRVKSTLAMFRWKPVDKGFSQQAPDLPAGKDWTSLCQKIVSENLSQLIINL